MRVAPATDLPRVDEHAVVIAASPDAVWGALLDLIDGTFRRGYAETYARIVGCADHSAEGSRPLAEGSTVPGFHVVRSEPRAELVLQGSHRFSTYELAFHLDDIGPGRTRLRAETRAAFPGVGGSVYRLLVITTHLHVVAVRRLLAGVTKRCRSRGA